MDEIENYKAYKDEIPGDNPMAMLNDLMSIERMQRQTGMKDSDSEEETTTRRDQFKKVLN